MKYHSCRRIIFIVLLVMMTMMMHDVVQVTYTANILTCYDCLSMVDFLQIPTIYFLETMQTEENKVQRQYASSSCTKSSTQTTFSSSAETMNALPSTEYMDSMMNANGVSVCVFGSILQSASTVCPWLQSLMIKFCVCTVDFHQKWRAQIRSEPYKGQQTCQIKVSCVTSFGLIPIGTSEAGVRMTGVFPILLELTKWPSS